MEQQSRLYAALPEVKATLFYLAPMKEKPFNYTYEPPLGVQRQNVIYESHTLSVINGRPLTFDLEKEGFVLAKYPSRVGNFYDQEEVRSAYYPEAAQFLKETIGAAEVIVFDHNVRNRARLDQGAREPVKRVHVDFTNQSGYSRGHLVLKNLGIDHPEALLQRRFAVINLWRPIAEPVQESPLAVCSANSIASQDLVAADLIYRDRVGETYLVTHNPSHRWFYFPQMQPDEVLFFKCFDSDQNAPARFAAHSAFDDPTSPADAPARASIELRAMVFYSD